MWTRGEPGRTGSADQLRITSPRADRTLRPYGPIRIVRVGAGLIAPR